VNIASYPLMMKFLDGSFQSNSGGHADPEEEINGTEEEWRKADNWFSEYWFGVEADELMRLVDWMGRQADSGYTMYEIDPDTDQMRPALPWVILDRYY
jgi:hypothetical protein